MSASLVSSPVLAPFVRFLTAPDAPRGEHPLEPAATLAAGMAGVGLFAGALAWAIQSAEVVGMGGDGAPLQVVPAFLVSVPLAQLLCFPPLYLWATMRGKTVSPVRMAAAAAAGPGALGAWLGASAPIFLLYALSGPVGLERSQDMPLVAILFLAFLVVSVGLFLGARNAVRAGANVGLEVPGPLVRLAHYAVVLWTTAILVIHLSA